MKKQALALAALITSASLFWPLPSQAKPAPKKPAPHPATAVSAPQQAALSWLALMDAGKYAQTWDACSPTAQAVVTRDQWVSTVQPVRAPLGKVQKRTLKSGQHTSTLPGVPPGDYSVLVYGTTFEKGVMLETVVLNHDKDGHWRVSGYFVKPAA